MMMMMMKCACLLISDMLINIRAGFRDVWLELGDMMMTCHAMLLC
jgi:hypothetical protein